MRSIIFAFLSPKSIGLFSSSRSIVFSRKLPAVYDARIYQEPISDKKQLMEKLDPKDPRNFLPIKAMLSWSTPVFYRHPITDKFINVIMKCGNKELSNDLVHDAFEIIKRRRYKLWKNSPEEKRFQIEMNPFIIFEKAIKLAQPLMRLRPCVRGGITYQVPTPINPKEAQFMAMKWFRDICREKSKKGKTSFENALASEVLATFDNEGSVITVKQEYHRQCEANRAYVNYRN